MEFVDPNEGMYGSIAREMADSGDWVTPRFNGVRYFEKPPLYYWLSALMISQFGPSEWAVRFWGAISALGTVLLIYRMGIRLYSRNAGLLAGVILFSSVGFFRYADVVFPDILFVFTLTLSLYGFVHGFLDDGKPQTRYWLFYLGVALAVLSKGIIGLVFPLMIVAIFLIVAGRRVPEIDGGTESAISQGELPKGSRKGLSSIAHSLFVSSYSPFAIRYSLLGVLLLLFVTVPWHILAAWKNDDFLWFYFVDNQFLRFFHSRNFLEDDIQLGTAAFLFAFQVWSFPWSLALPVSLRPGFPRLNGDSSPAARVRLVIGLWGLIVLGFFCLSSAKLEHYSLPALPAVSLLVGARWAEVWASRAPDRGLKVCLGFGAMSCIALGVGLLWLASDLTPGEVAVFLSGLSGDYRALDARGGALPYPVLPFAQLAGSLGWLLLLGPLAAFLCLVFGKVRSSFGFYFATAAGISVLVFRLFLIVEPHHSTKALAAALEATSVRDEPVVHEGQLIDSGGLPFYTGREIYVLDGVRGDLAFGSRYPETRRLFLDRKAFLHLWQGPGRVFFVSNLWWFPGQEQMSGKLNKTAYLVGQFGLRKLYSNRPPLEEAS